MGATGAHEQNAQTRSTAPERRATTAGRTAHTSDDARSDGSDDGGTHTHDAQHRDDRGAPGGDHRGRGNRTNNSRRSNSTDRHQGSRTTATTTRTDKSEPERPRRKAREQRAENDKNRNTDNTPFLGPIIGSEVKGALDYNLQTYKRGALASALDRCRIMRGPRECGQ